jgi:hypothetical protein
VTGSQSTCWDCDDDLVTGVTGCSDELLLDWFKAMQHTAAVTVIDLERCCHNQAAPSHGCGSGVAATKKVNVTVTETETVAVTMWQ